MAIAVYARVLRGEFQFDDLPSIVGNPDIKNLGAAVHALAEPFAHGGRPVAQLSFAIDYSIGRLNPFPYHLSSLLAHLAVVALVRAFTRTLLRRAGASAPEGISLAVAGLFALHPLQTEAVSYVVQRSEVLASGFYLGALLLLLASERASSSRSRWLGLGAVAAYLLALGSKQIAVTLPAAYLLVSLLVPDGRKTEKAGPQTVAPGLRLHLRKALLLAAVPLLLSAALAWGLLHSLSSRGAEDAGFSVPGLGPATYFLTELRAVATYLRLVFWPAGQTILWPFQLSRSLTEPAVLASGALLLALVAGACALLIWSRGAAAGEERSDLSAADRAAARVAGVGVLWFFLLLSPTSSFVPVADVLVEHRVYLALLGPLLAVAVAAERGLARLSVTKGLPTARTLTLVAFLLLALLTFRRNAVWETRVALWTDAAAKAPSYQRPHLQLAYAHWARGDPEGAIREYGRALDTGGRGTPKEEAFILTNLAVAELAAGHVEDAVASLRRSLTLQPGNADALANLALAQLRRGDLAAAEESATEALRLNPESAGALMVLGGGRMERGDAKGAAEVFLQAARLDPDDAERWFNLARAYDRTGDAALMCRALRAAAGAQGAPGLLGQVRGLLAGKCK